MLPVNIDYEFLHPKALGQDKPIVTKTTEESISVTIIKDGLSQFKEVITVASVGCKIYTTDVVSTLPITPAGSPFRLDGYEGIQIGK